MTDRSSGVPDAAIAQAGMRRLDGKCILIAGAGGIGGGLARRFAAEGAAVVLGDIVPSTARVIAAEITAAGGQAIAVELDGADQSSIRAAVDTACDRFGGLDGLHANFASFVDDGEYDGIAQMPLAAFDETIRVNLRGYVLCSQAAIPALLDRGGGAILFTSSIAAYRPEGRQLAYAMAKEGAHALMRHIAVRYGMQGIRANSIAPGTIMHGDLEATLPPAFLDHLRGIAQIKSRFGRPEDIAALAALLMSDEGSYITGQVMAVDGGATMRA